ncbi:MAG TPA: metallophosphoesterase [Allosphingosinicella sp.]|jgi:hypothetical protein
MRRTFSRLFLFLGLIGLALLAWAYRTAIADPVVRETRVPLPGLAPGSKPLRALLISDIHVAGPDMTPERLARIVVRANRLEPDVVLIAGDLVGDKGLSTHIYTVPEMVAPLGGLRSRLGTFAVLGNHDHWRNEQEVKVALREREITVLDNEAAQAGPLAIGGLDDAFTDHADLPGLLRELDRLPGARLILSHSPDPFPDMPSGIGLMLAGHTHCGQINLPFHSSVSHVSRYGDRYACGRIEEEGKVLIVGAGLGTSVLPLRLGAVPDIWLVTLVPPQASSSTSQ